MEIFSDRAAAKSQWKFVFQKTCSIYSTMVLFLVRGNINIFIRSILDHFWYLLRTLNQFQDKIHDLFKICRLKITFSSILTKYLKILEDSLCSLPTKNYSTHCLYLQLHEWWVRIIMIKLSKYKGFFSVYTHIKLYA